MKDKYYDFTSSLVMGIIFIIVGIVLLIGKAKLYQELISILIFILWGNAFIHLIRLHLRKQN